MKKTINISICLIAAAFVMLLLTSCYKTAVNNNHHKSSGGKKMEKEGMWYKGKFWEGYEDGGISEDDIDSEIERMMKTILKAKAVLNGKAYSLDYCTPSMKGDQLLFISVFDTDKIIILFIDEDDIEPGKTIMISAELRRGNIFNRDQKRILLAEGKITFNTEEDEYGDDLYYAEGKLSDNSNNEYTLSLHFNEDVMGAGNTKLKIKDNEVWLSGELGTVSYSQFKDLIEKYPEVDTIVFTNVPGSMNDDVNMHTGRLIRQAGFTTKVLEDSEIYSGGVDLFCAGKKRVVHKGAKIGVHSWSEGAVGKTALDYSKDHPAHRQQLAYFTEMLGNKGGTGFYFYTLQAAPAESIYVMKDEEIKHWNVATEFRE